jgi:hypothetical protein
MLNKSKYKKHVVTMKERKPNETSISIRTTKRRKSEVRSILAVLNDKRKPNERKKTDKYLEEFFIESYKQDPKFFSVKVELIEEKKHLRNINREIENLEYLKGKSEEKINKLESILANDSLDNYANSDTNSILVSGDLKKALNHLIRLCKDKNILTLEDWNKKLPSEYVTASLNVVDSDITKKDLIKAFKQEITKNPDLIIDFKDDMEI